MTFSPKLIVVRIIYFLLFSILFLNCKRTDILDEETFIKIYAEAIIYKDTASTANYINKIILKSILDKYSVTLDEYKQTVDYYNQDFERWEKFFSKAVVYLESKQKLEQK